MWDTQGRTWKARPGPKGQHFGIPFLFFFFFFSTPGCTFSMSWNPCFRFQYEYYHTGSLSPVQLDVVSWSDFIDASDIVVIMIVQFPTAITKLQITKPPASFESDSNTRSHPEIQSSSCSTAPLTRIHHVTSPVPNSNQVAALKIKILFTATLDSNADDTS